MSYSNPFEDPFNDLTLKTKDKLIHKDTERNKRVFSSMQKLQSAYEAGKINGSKDVLNYAHNKLHLKNSDIKRLCPDLKSKRQIGDSLDIATERARLYVFQGRNLHILARDPRSIQMWDASQINKYASHKYRKLKADYDLKAGDDKHLSAGFRLPDSISRWSSLAMHARLNESLGYPDSLRAHGYLVKSGVLADGLNRQDSELINGEYHSAGINMSTMLEDMDLSNSACLISDKFQYKALCNVKSDIVSEAHQQANHKRSRSQSHRNKSYRPIYHGNSMFNSGSNKRRKLMILKRRRSIHR